MFYVLQTSCVFFFPLFNTYNIICIISALRNPFKKECYRGYIPARMRDSEGGYYSLSVCRPIIKRAAERERALLKLYFSRTYRYYDLV